MNIPFILKHAREILADEERWTRGHLATDKDGQEIEPDHPKACAWCMEGAVVLAGRLYGENTNEEHQECLARIRHAANASTDRIFSWPADFNDDPATTHADVLAVLDKAIAEGE